MKTKGILLFILIMGSFFALYGGEESDYTWLKLQEGIALYNSKKYGDAVVIFEKCKQLKRSWPLVDYWIGRVYEVEGDFNLATKQYKKSIELYEYESVYSEELLNEVMLHLADVYLKMGKKTLFCDTLDKLLDQGGSSTPLSRQKVYDSLLIAFQRGGLNKVLELYRLKEGSEAEVYRRKADYFFKNKKWEEASLYLMLTIVASLSTIINEMEEADAQFIFTTKLNANEKRKSKYLSQLNNKSGNNDLDLLEGDVYSDISDLLVQAGRIDIFREYIDHSKLMANIYKFAEVMKQIGKVADKSKDDKIKNKAEAKRQSAIDLLWICIRYPYDKKWSQNANRLFLEISAID